MTAFLDVPAASFEAASAFWAAVTRTTVSAPRGVDGEFATLVPSAGDAYLRVQRRAAGPARIHLDLHVDDVDTVVAAAVGAGAALVARRGYAVLTSPAGLTFCVVPHRGEAVRPAPVERADGGRELIDQVCIDVPPERYDAECAFWTVLTGWPHRTGSTADLSLLERPPGQPLRVLLQRLGAEDGATAARAHLDLAVGAPTAAAVAAHVAGGAVVHHEGPRWVTLVDPAGLPYCLTERDPDTGTIAAPPA